LPIALLALFRQPFRHAWLLELFEFQARIDALQALTQGAFRADSRMRREELLDVIPDRCVADVPERRDCATAAEAGDFFRKVSPMALSMRSFPPFA
jgi:hypothetical protein